MDRSMMLNGPSHPKRRGRMRRRALGTLLKLKKAGAGRIERQQQRVRVTGKRHGGASNAVVAATMFAFLPFCKPLAALDSRLAKYILVPSRQAKMSLRSSSPVESRLPRDREDPCSFRTRLVDPLADSDADIAFESTDKVDGDDLKFDDAQCISVGRSMGKFKAMPGALSHQQHGQVNDDGIAKELGPRLYSTPADMVSPEKDEALDSAESFRANMGNRPCFTPVDEQQDTSLIYRTFSDPTTAYRTVLIQGDDNDDNNDDDSSNMEAMNMPFWNLPKRQKRHSAHHPAGDTIPDDMSIISSVSFIPIYFPSDIAKQQRPRHRALIKRLIRTKARAARQTMRELKRTCRDAVGNVFVDAAATPHRPPKCVAVGSVY